MVEFSTKDVVYRSVGDVMLSATLYTPFGPGPFPAIVEVHGGAWNFCDRSRNMRLCQYLAATGIIVMALDFRAPPHIYPSSVCDVNAGIRWLKRHAATLGGDPQRVAALGSSSGGHLVLLNGLRPRDEAYCEALGPGEFDAQLHFMVTCWPIVDPMARYEMAKSRGLQNLTAAHDLYWVPACNMAVGNPQLIVDAGRYTSLPPLLIVQGTKDANMTQEMIDRFVASYRDAGGRLEIEKYEAQPHDFFMTMPDSSETRAAMAWISDFIFANSR